VIPGDSGPAPWFRDARSGHGGTAAVAAATGISKEGTVTTHTSHTAHSAGTAHRTPMDREVRLLAGISAVLAVLGLVKFLGLLAASGFDPAQAPWAFLVLLSAPFVAAVLLLPRRPRAGAVVAGFASLLLLVVTVKAMVTHGLHQQYWGDHLVVFLGAPLAAAAIVTALRVVRRA
jgi:hypothetical protein